MKRTISRLLPVMLILFLLAGTTIATATPNTRKTSSSRKKVSRKVTAMTGYEYAVQQRSKTSFSYTRDYQKSGKNIFTTTYNIYDNRNKAIRNIVAVHHKAAKSVEVTVKDLTRNGFPVLNIERTGYTAPYMGRFGSIGKVGAIANAQARNTAPGQLQLKFTSRRFDYVKVVHIAGAHEDSGADLSIYILDEKN